MNEKILPQKIIEQLPNELKEVKFVYLPKGYWYGLTKKCKGVRIYIEKNESGDEKPRIEMSELQKTGQFSGGVWIEGFKSMFKKNKNNKVKK